MTLLDALTHMWQRWLLQLAEVRLEDGVSFITIVTFIIVLIFAFRRSITKA